MSVWQENTGHLRMGVCATDGCNGRSIWQLQAGDVWSDYCRECRENIDAMNAQAAEPEEWLVDAINRHG